MAAQAPVLPNLSNLSNLFNLPPSEDASGGLGPAFNQADYQAQLVSNGFVVIPTTLGYDLQKLKQVQDAFDQHFRDSPELRNARPEDDDWKNVLGGFAALGNPSSFHHPFVRAMREMCEAAVLDNDALPLYGRKLEQCFDRMMRRIPGEATDAESWHRDEALNTKPGDDIFGGWINLDEQPQYFSCAPHTHIEEGAHDRNAGFAKITTPEQMANYQRIANRHGPVAIPSGHILIFYERLVHEVHKVTATHIMRRLFLGWRATSASAPLFGQMQTDAWMQSQAPPKIKSGQQPAVYPSAYYNFPRNFKTLTKFSESVFVRECLYEHTVKSGLFANSKWMRVARFMKGLVEYGLPTYVQYNMYERNIMFPQRLVQLRTFDSPNQRVAYQLVSVPEWQAHLRNPTAMDVLGNPTRRPIPVRY